MPDASAPPPHRLDRSRLLGEAQDLSRHAVPGYIDVEAVGAVLRRVEVDHVFIGGPVIGCHTGIARASKDVDVIVGNDGHARAVSAIRAAWPRLSIVRLSEAVRFRDDDDRVERIDCLRSDSDLNRLVLTRRVLVSTASGDIPIPDIEALFSLKFAAALSDSRDPVKRGYDEADLHALVAANPAIDRAAVERLCETIATGYGLLAVHFITTQSPS